MERFYTASAEKLLAIGSYMARAGRMPNPYQPLTPADRAWLELPPEAFYAIPDEPPRLNFRAIFRGRGPLSGQFTFPSSYVSGEPRNNTVYGNAILAKGGQARAALVFLHGHAMNTYTLLEWYARPAAYRGLDVYFMELPYHMQRAPEGTWSGQCSLNSDIRGSALAFMQGVRDVRSLISWIECERRAPVILTGVSLGAFTSLMTAVVDDRPKALISILGGGSLAQLIWDGYQFGRSKRQLQAAGVTHEALERDWALLGPANWQPKIDRERLLLLAGQYDPIVTPNNTRRLWEAWGRPELHWYPGGHATILHYHHALRDEFFRFVTRQLEDSASK